LPKPKVITISSVILALPSITSKLKAVGCTLWVRSTTIRPFSRSAHIIVPVYPVWPKEFKVNNFPQGGLAWMGRVSHPNALLLLYGSPSYLV